MEYLISASSGPVASPDCVGDCGTVCVARCDTFCVGKCGDFCAVTCNSLCLALVCGGWCYGMWGK